MIASRVERCLNHKPDAPAKDERWRVRLVQEYRLLQSSRQCLAIALERFKRRGGLGAAAVLPPPFLGSFRGPLARAGARRQSFFEGDGILVPVVRVFLQAAQNDLLKIGGHGLMKLLTWNDRFVGMRMQHLQR